MRKITKNINSKWRLTWIGRLPGYKQIKSISKGRTCKNREQKNTSNSAQIDVLAKIMDNEHPGAHIETMPNQECIYHK